MKKRTIYGIIKVPEIIGIARKEAIFVTYEELKKAYEESQKRCSELEQEIAEKDKVIENKDLRIEHLTALVLKRNKMLFGQKRDQSRP